MTAISNDLSRWESQNLALASVTQCAALVHKLAYEAEASQAELLACVNPLLVLDPDSIGEIYPRPIDLSLGLQTVQSIFSNSRVRENAELVKYTLGILLLRKKLQENNEMQHQIRTRLGFIDALQTLPDSTADEEALAAAIATQDRTFEQLARLYQDTISKLPYRIQVQGKIENLKNEAIANRIRALLLAGIRSAVLWHQLGGRRWRLVVYRKRIQEVAGDIRRKLLTQV